MKILVTGGAGYIGSILVPELLKNSHVVSVVDNFMYHQTSLAEHCINNNLNIIRGDARERSVIEPLLKKADVIIPLACITGAPACDQNPETAKTLNFEAVNMIARLKSSQQMLIFPTTNSGYGIGKEGVLCTEETPLHPISLYGKLKVDAEKAVLDSKNAITLRLATAFGENTNIR